MALKSIEQRVEDTIQRFNTQIISAQHAEVIIQQSLTDAFSDVYDLAEKNELYKKLSLKIHPDNINFNDAPFARLLREHDLTRLPQQCLNAVMNPPAKTPLLYKALNQFRLMSLQYKRYPKPLRQMNQLFSGIVTTSLYMGSMLAALPIIILGIATMVVSVFHNMLVNLITNGEQQKLIVAFNQSDKAKTQVINDMVKNQRFGNLSYLYFNQPETAFVKQSESEIIQQILLNYIAQTQATNPTLDGIELQKKAEQALENDIEEQKEPIGFDLISITAKAYVQAITRPLPETIGDKGVSLLTRIAQALIAPFSLLLISTNELIKYLLEKGARLQSATFLLIKAASLMITNAPLYVLDSFRYLGKSLHALFDSSVAYEPTTSSYHLMIKYLPEAEHPVENPSVLPLAHAQKGNQFFSSVISEQIIANAAKINETGINDESSSNQAVATPH